MLQTPVRSFTHTESGRNVILVGVIHIGKRSYYQQIQNLINQATNSGHSILYESVGKMNDKDIAALPKKQRIIVRQMKTVFASIKIITSKLLPDDVIHQKQGLAYPDSWIRTDLDLSHVSTLFAEADLNFAQIKDNEADEDLFADMPEKLLKFMKVVVRVTIKILPGIGAVTGFFKKFDPKKRARDHIIITLRNEVAVKGILNQAQTSDVVSIWGAAHLPGIEQQLKDAGYQHTKTIWYDAF